MPYVLCKILQFQDFATATTDTMSNQLLTINEEEPVANLAQLQELLRQHNIKNVLRVSIICYCSLSS